MDVELVEKIVFYRLRANIPKNVTDKEIVEVLDGLENHSADDITQILREEFTS
jgi:hypothetical protein